MGVIHGGGCPDISFDSVASRSVGVVVEPKACEGCLRPFFRSVMGPMRLREKFCPRCRAKKKPSARVQ